MTAYVRTDHIGAIRRSIIVALMWMIERVRPMPIEKATGEPKQDESTR